jgi:hypothetical protein
MKKCIIWTEKDKKLWNKVVENKTEIMEHVLKIK